MSKSHQDRYHTGGTDDTYRKNYEKIFYQNQESKLEKIVSKNGKTTYRLKK